MMPFPVDRALAATFPRWWAGGAFNALDGLALSVVRGSSVGIVGHNGAGKTTLLKVIAGVTSPTTGSVEVNGRIAALIDLLVGFHPDLTGIENVQLLGSMYGFSRRTMRDRLDSIFDFAEISDAATTPVKRYSAGMAARLGFATLTALEADILLIDEVLTVGDASFQRKCISWLEGYRVRGGTLLFVSHNLGLIRNMTERVGWLDHGRLVQEGPTARVLGDYARAMENRDSGQYRYRQGEARRLIESRGLLRWGTGEIRADSVHFREPTKEDHSLEVTVEYEAADGVSEAMFCVGFVDESGHQIGATKSPRVTLKPDGGTVRCRLSPVPLTSGIYFPVIWILTKEGVVTDSWRLDRALVIDWNGHLGEADVFGPVDLLADWSYAPSSSS